MASTSLQVNLQPGAEAVLEPASMRAYITDVRLDKAGLSALPHTSWGLANSRVVEPPNTAPARMCSTMAFSCLATVSWVMLATGMA